MRNAPKKIFMLESGQYIEIDYSYYQRLIKENTKRRFLLLGGMLMEVSEEDYVQMNREKSRLQYQQKLVIRSGELSYDIFCEDSWGCGLPLEEEIPDVCEIVVTQMMIEKMLEVMKELSEEEQQLIQALYFGDDSEKTYGEKLGLSQAAVHKRKKKVLEKLRGLLEQ